MGTNKKNTHPKAEKTDRGTKIVLVRRFGEQDLMQLYAKYVADKILAMVSEEEKNCVKF